jgi:2-amino-4-hydroxy-6-hydroxymethyldihydropteridine diphosphokinase
MPCVAIALGSNVGDRRAHLQFALEQLSTVLTGLRISPIYETAAVGVGPQPQFLNAVVIGETALSAPALLDRLLAFEQDAGRVRPFPGAPRTLDLDLVLYGDAIVNEPGLVVPHPRFRGRRFVLQPLADLAPDMLDPVTGRSVRELLAALRGPRGPRPQSVPE